MKKLKKKTIITLSTVIFISIFVTTVSIYTYILGFSYKTLNLTRKVSITDTVEDEDIQKETEEVSKTSKEITEEIIDDIGIATVVRSTNRITTTQNWWEYPDEILETTRSGNDLLVLVNKKYKLPSTYTPSDLVNASSTGIRRGENYLVRSIIINDLTRLVNDIGAEGIDISIVSAYRSYATQQTTYQYWVNFNGGNISEADKISARAGHSQHQLGTTVDFSTNEAYDKVGSGFTGTKAQVWLSNNAHKYGFALSYPLGGESVTGYSYESWHYRYIGVDNALAFKSSGLILDQWLASK